MYNDGAGPLPLFDQMYAERPGVFRNEFAICFNKDGESGGKIVFGGGSETPGMEYIDYDESEGMGVWSVCVCVCVFVPVFVLCVCACVLWWLFLCLLP